MVVVTLNVFFVPLESVWVQRLSVPDSRAFCYADTHTLALHRLFGADTDARFVPGPPGDGGLVVRNGGRQGLVGQVAPSLSTVVLPSRELQSCVTRWAYARERLCAVCRVTDGRV